MAERRVAELEEQMARMRSPAQELEHRLGNRGLHGQQAAPLIPRPLQVRAGEQRRDGQPQMATNGVQPQMAAPTYAQVAQMPPRQLTA